MNHCVYVRRHKDRSVQIFLLLYIDDMLVAGASLEDVIEIKRKLSLEFNMKDLGQAARIDQTPKKKKKL